MSYLAARILANLVDLEDIKAVHILQNQMKIKVASVKPYTHSNYDEASYEAFYLNKSAPRKASELQLTVKNVLVNKHLQQRWLLRKNKFDSYSINNLTARPNKDDSSAWR